MAIIKYRGVTYGSNGGGSSSVEITPTLQSGTKVADYEIDGISGELYAPTPTEVEANPSDTATTDLEKIDIGGVVYGIPTGVDDIADLSDVNISSPTNGQILKYNTTTSKWENANESGGTTVVANPSGTASEDLTSLQVGNTIYGIPGGGGGGYNDGYYKETELYSNTSSSASITLNNSYLDYDALIFLNKYNSGGYILDSIVSTTGITEAADNNCQFRIHCGSDSAYIFGTVTSDTQFALTMRNYFVTKVIGINYTKNKTKALIPKMTSATTPSGTVTASSYNNSTMYPYMAFDGANGGLNTLTNTWLPASGETTSWIIYEFDELKLFESLKTRTGGSAASNNVVFDVEGKKADGTWENCLASGTDVTLSFPVYSYTYTDTPLNGKEYNAIRLTSHSTMFVTQQYGCGIDVIQVYGKNVSS